MTIQWLSTETNPPLADREIIAFDESKIIPANSSAKRSRIMKFNKSFSEEQIIETMLDDNLTLWSYV